MHVVGKMDKSKDYTMYVRRYVYKKNELVGRRGFGGGCNSTAVSSHVGTRDGLLVARYR